MSIILQDWALLAQAVDRLTFGCYLVAVGLLFSTYLIGAATSKMPDIKYVSL